MIMMHILTHLSCPWSIFATVCRQIVHSSDLRESRGAIMKKFYYGRTHRNITFDSDFKSCCWDIDF